MSIFNEALYELTASTREKIIGDSPQAAPAAFQEAPARLRRLVKFEDLIPSYLAQVMSRSSAEVNDARIDALCRISGSIPGTEAWTVLELGWIIEAAARCSERIKDED